MPVRVSRIRPRIVAVALSATFRAVDAYRIVVPCRFAFPSARTSIPAQSPGIGVDPEASPLVSPRTESSRREVNTTGEVLVPAVTRLPSTVKEP
jgi:hypothetical protein